MSTCIICNSAHGTQWEPKANAIVCAGCYNDFAIEKGWEVEVVEECDADHDNGEFHRVPSATKCPLCGGAVYECVQANWCQYQFCDSPTCEWENI